MNNRRISPNTLDTASKLAGVDAPNLSPEKEGLVDNLLTSVIDLMNSIPFANELAKDDPNYWTIPHDEHEGMLLHFEVRVVEIGRYLHRIGGTRLLLCAAALMSEAMYTDLAKRAETLWTRRGWINGK